jgi:hypothetical protein
MRSRRRMWRLASGADARCTGARTGVARVEGFVPDQHPVEKLESAGLNPSFHDGVHPGHLDTGEHDLDLGVDEDGVKQFRVFAVAIANDVPGMAAASCRSMARLRAAWVTHAAVG